MSIQPVLLKPFCSFIGAWLVKACQSLSKRSTECLFADQIRFKLHVKHIYTTLTTYNKLQTPILNTIHQLERVSYALIMIYLPGTVRERGYHMTKSMTKCFAYYLSTQHMQDMRQTQRANAELQFTISNTIQHYNSSWFFRAYESKLPQQQEVSHFSNISPFFQGKGLKLSIKS